MIAVEELCVVSACNAENVPKYSLAEPFCYGEILRVLRDRHCDAISAANDVLPALTEKATLPDAARSLTIATLILILR